MTRNRFGIVGGGQLARMLVQACEGEDAECWVLDPDPACPAVLAGAHHVEGDSWNIDSLRKLATSVDVVTVEIEHVDVDNLKTIEREGTLVIPSTLGLTKVVNKCTQKQVFTKAGLPTAPFLPHPANSRIDEAPFGFPMVWKASRGGYDGRGVVVVQDATQLPLSPDVEGYIEAFVPTQMEVAVMVAVSEDGDVTTWNTVEMTFNSETNMLQHLIVPARIDEALNQEVQKTAREAVLAIDAAGIFGVEMFVTSDAEVLINEVAPRTHNSGHVSIDSAETSQFRQQFRILSGQPLLPTVQTSPAVMVNLLGEPGYSGATVVEHLEEIERLPGVHVHLYGKQKCFDHRKMGHATVTADSIREAIEMSEQVTSQFVIRGADKSG